MLLDEMAYARDAKEFNKSLVKCHVHCGSLVPYLDDVLVYVSFAGDRQRVIDNACNTGITRLIAGIDSLFGEFVLPTAEEPTEVLRHMRSFDLVYEIIVLHVTRNWQAINKDEPTVSEDIIEYEFLVQRALNDFYTNPEKGLNAIWRREFKATEVMMVEEEDIEAFFLDGNVLGVPGDALRVRPTIGGEMTGHHLILAFFGKNIPDVKNLESMAMAFPIVSAYFGQASKWVPTRNVEQGEALIIDAFIPYNGTNTFLPGFLREVNLLHPGVRAVIYGNEFSIQYPGSYPSNPMKVFPGGRTRVSALHEKKYIDFSTQWKMQRELNGNVD